jgi:hypothetical protein
MWYNGLVAWAWRSLARPIMLARQAVLLNPLKSVHPLQLPSCNFCAPVTPLESALLQVFILKNFNSPGMNTYKKSGGRGQLWLTKFSLTCLRPEQQQQRPNPDPSAPSHGQRPVFSSFLDRFRAICFQPVANIPFVFKRMRALSRRGADYPLCFHILAHSFCHHGGCGGPVFTFPVFFLSRNQSKNDDALPAAMGPLRKGRAVFRREDRVKLLTGVLRLPEKTAVLRTAGRQEHVQGITHSVEAAEASLASLRGGPRRLPSP